MNGCKLTVSLALILAFNVFAARAGIRFPPVELSSANAVITNQSIVIRWRTAAEAGVISFDLYRQTGDQQWLKINDAPIIAANSILGGDYEVVDSSARLFEKNWYRLVQTDQLGNVTCLKPFALKSTVEISASPRAAVASLTVNSSSGGTNPPIVKPLGVSSLAVLDGSTFVKITTTNSGLQFVDAAALANLLGQSLTTVQTAIAQGQFKLTTSGQPVTWLPAPDNGSLLFYAETHRDNYSTNNIYWLTSQTNGVIGTENGQAPAPTSAAIWYPASQYYENNAIYASSLPLGAEDDPWMWSQLISSVPGSSTANYFAGLDHLTPGSDRPALLTIQLWGGVAANHYIQITVNTNNVLGQWSWSGLTPTNLSVSMPSALLVSGTNKLSLLALTNGVLPRSTSTWDVNDFTLSYPRTYTAVNGLIDFTANSNSVVSVNGFAGSNLSLLDVSNPKQPLLVTNLTIDQPSSTYRLSFTPASPSAHYVAWQTGAAISVYTLALGQVAGLSANSNAADYVIVSPPSLLMAATNLSAYRRQTGLKTIIAPLDQVYNEFGYGFPTPHAIQSLVATAWTNWSVAPRYLVLLGRGTYDFMNLKQQNDNLTPPLMVSSVFGIFASDSLMGVTTTNGLPNVAVGRLPGLTTNDILKLIDKIKNYESNAPPVSPQGLLIADAVPDSAGDFQGDILQTDAVLTNKFTDTLLFSTNTQLAEPLHSMILTNWYRGVDFVNYSGHGAISQFGNAGYLTSADATNSANYFILNCPRLPVVTAMTCISGQYSQPGLSCLGEYLLKPVAGGAIAFYGPSGLSLSGEASELNVRLTTLLRSNAQLALGDMIRQAVADHISQDLPTVPVWIYNLMGDPALHYSLARNLPPLKITSITPKTISWSGGLPPYQLQIATNLSVPSAWQPLGSTLIGNQASLTLTNGGAMGFFRVQGSQ